MLTFNYSKETREIYIRKDGVLLGNIANKDLKSKQLHLNAAWYNVDDIGVLVEIIAKFKDMAALEALYYKSQIEPYLIEDTP